MTKAQQILDLYPRMYAEHGKAACRLIADTVGSKPSYVRTVTRQRKGRGQSEHDVRYLSSDLGRRMIATRRPKNSAATRALIRTGDAEAGREAGRAAYRAVRAAGGTIEDASQAYRKARIKARMRTGNKLAARAAYAATPAEPLP